jgi:hypothetical protein
MSMNSRSGLVASLAFGVGVVSTALLIGRAGDATRHARAEIPGEKDASDPRDDLTELRSEVERLKQKATDQAHVMVSVDYHFGNLWFAGQHENWALAEFYWNETRSHLRWAVRVIPIRKDDRGEPVDLKAILEAAENSPLKQLEEAIKAHDQEKFVAAYKFTIETCYACHKASDKPYLRPRIPDQPPTTMVNFDPGATWPK